MLEKNRFLHLAHRQLGFIHADKRHDREATLVSFRKSASYGEHDDPVSAMQAQFQIQKLLREFGEIDGA